MRLFPLYFRILRSLYLSDSRFISPIYGLFSRLYALCVPIVLRFPLSFFSSFLSIIFLYNTFRCDSFAFIGASVRCTSKCN
jgi:sulfite exporter TauE/SafE